MLEVKNAEDLIQQVKDIIGNSKDDVNAKLKQFEAEVKQNGEATKSTTDELVKLTQEIEGLTDIKQSIIDINQKLDDGIANGPKVVKTMADELAENAEDLKQLSKGSTSVKTVSIKADTLRASVTNNENALDLVGIGQLAHAKLTAYDIFNKIPVSDSNTNGVIRYYDWDSATTVRAAATIAEGAVFPESTAKWVKQTLTLEKIGDTLPVSEEFFEDSAMFAAELDMFLRTNVAIKRNDQLVNGNGTTPNLKGIVTTVSAFTAAASGITDANIYDLLVKVSESITATGGSKYMPNFAMMNIVDINRMKLKKDANNNYMIPPFVSRDGKQVDTMLVLEENAITANTLVVGDSRYARIYERKGVELARGVVDAQFAEDMETLKARTRLAFLIRDADVGGFAKVTDIDADLVTLAT